jgi:uncharacterized membrane protein
MARQKLTVEKALPWILVVTGIVGLICSFIISLDKMKLLENPSFQPACDLNPIVACGSVMKSAQGSAFNFPNPWLGLAAFAVLLTVGVAILAGAKFKRWFWQGLLAGCALGLAFAYWLLWESVYRIHALCPYCLTVDVVVITTSWYVLQYNLKTGNIKLPKGKVFAAGQKFIRRHHLDILILWFIVLIAIILNHFWYYFGQHL